MRRLVLLTICFSFLLLPTGNYAATSHPVTPAPTTEDPKKVAQAAFEALRAMPKKERKQKLKAAKKEIRKFKEARKRGMEADTNTLLLVILAILLPPLAVYLHQRETNTKFWVTLLLWLLGIAGAFFFSWLLIFAAVVYALIVILGGA